VARRTNGQTCTGDSQCASTHCTNGVCCGSAVCPSCQSCAVALHEGSCWNVAAGTSDGSCLDDGAASCGNDGKCDGNGSCELYPATTVCSQGCNADNSEFNVKYCDGGGLCSTVLVSFPCASMMCDSLLGCLL
jgi:hypothetical protein